jgi:hypothetical protein
MELVDFSGKSIWKKTIPFTVNSNSAVHYTLDKKELPQFDTAACYLEAGFLVSEKVLARNTYYFVKPKHLKLPQSSLRFTIKNGGIIEISSGSFCKDVYLYSDESGVDFSDNFFTLKPGERKEIRVTGSLKGALPPVYSIIFNNLRD